MITQGQALLLQSNVRSWMGLLLVGSFALWMGLLIWQTSFNQNPIANAMATSIYQQEYAASLTN